MAIRDSRKQAFDESPLSLSGEGPGGEGETSREPDAEVTNVL
jgi:hypothetical protein